MKYTLWPAVLFFAAVILATFPVVESQAQPNWEDGQEHTDTQISGGKALALSLLLPGLGHRYVHGGNWDGWASAFAVADVSLWAGLLGSEWHRNHMVESYTSFAAAHANADVDGKERDFFLNLASYMSSEEFTEVQLRNRNWGLIGYTEDPSYQWRWDSEGNYAEFRRIREGAESLRRRRTVIITTLVANRLISGFTALRAAGRAREARMEFSVGVPPSGASVPMAHVKYSF